MFPKDFLFGASMSGFQVEMGYAKGDLDPNTDWFVWVREPENLINSVVSGHLPEYGVGYWYNFPTIHKLASDFGMNVLRTNIEWSRIFPRPTYDVDVKVEQTESESHPCRSTSVRSESLTSSQTRMRWSITVRSSRI